jgi:hypothetical protein
MLLFVPFNLNMIDQLNMRKEERGPKLIKDMI